MSCPALHPTATGVELMVENGKPVYDEHGNPVIRREPIRCYHGKGHRGMHGNGHREWTSEVTAPPPMTSGTYDDELTASPASPLKADR